MVRIGRQASAAKRTVKPARNTQADFDAAITQALKDYPPRPADRQPPARQRPGTRRGSGPGRREGSGRLRRNSARGWVSRFNSGTY